MDDVRITAPPGRTCGSPARRTFTTPRMLTSIRRSIASSGVSSIGRSGPTKTPALGHSTSIAPNRSTVRATIASTEARSRTSAATVRSCSAGIWPASASSRAPLMSAAATA